MLFIELHRLLDFEGSYSTGVWVDNRLLALVPTPRSNNEVVAHVWSLDVQWNAILLSRLVMLPDQLEECAHSSFALASIPLGIGSAIAQEAKTTQGTAADLGVMSISLKDAIQPNFGFQGALQGAGTPNKAVIGDFLPLVTGDNSVFFLDAQANANFVDYDNYSSIINTKVAGTTISTSSRLGYRFLNSDRSWMFGVNAGYDSRPMATGAADTSVNVTNSSTVFYQQVAAGLEAVSNTWNFNEFDSQNSLHALINSGSKYSSSLNTKLRLRYLLNRFSWVLKIFFSEGFGGQIRLE